ncbi:MAG: threonine/serine dehydratase [Gammaproteobacteria bacterium]|jgi:threonine dehydratase|nr:threonine/serine dehydratase [Gammaproteobacteria bacterium]MDH3846570.1 threonine/serine dehydratase [Gammaproteobacteria bacterium]MDH3863102.1 threonine/serine dehydratase [Gammaproteobacteria bacterium]MDH3904687.1 threonine/serine dehydratase [Gammaproteobacteria bacterium]MDH4004556.1 threonine/serine dehydratase [Gammaproteobacteria bacterium]
MIDIAAIEAAAGRLDGVAVRTPLIRNDELDRIAGGRVLVKAENLQAIGSFKIRGAYNLMSQLSGAETTRGVVAFSSGNHAQGVALAGRLLGIHAAIVMPEDAPRAKIDSTRRLGGEIITYDRYTGDREAIASKVATERGAALVPSYDHEHIIAGQGTVGLEIAEQALEIQAPPDQVLINCGGGGLSAGSAVALKARLKAVSIRTVEPDDFDDTARSIAADERLMVVAGSRSICDSLLAETPGLLPFEIHRQLFDAGLTVSDREVCNAMRFAFQNLKMVVEPGGAVSLAAVLSGKIETAGKTTAVVISGGNVDLEQFAAIQESAD